MKVKRRFTYNSSKSFRRITALLMKQVVLPALMIIGFTAIANAQTGSDTVSVVQADSSVVRYVVTNDGIQKVSSVPAEEAESKQGRYWFKELKKGRIHLNDSTVHYPRFIRFCWDTYKWGDKAFNSYDTTYVKSTGMNWKVIFKNNNWLDYFSCTPFDKMKFKFSNTAPSTTLGAYISFMAVSVGYAIDLDKLLGKQISSRRFEFSFTCARFFAEYYRVISTGAMNLTIKDYYDNEKYRFKDFTGLKRRSWGINAYYFFNNRKYAQAAAYCFSKIQRRSAGSFLAGINISHQNFSTEPDKIKEEFKIEGETDLKETFFNYTDYCLSGGYGYNWVLGKHWLLNGTALTYTGLKHSHTSSTTDGDHNYFAINFKAKVSVTYSKRHFFASLSQNFDTHLFNTGEYRFRSFLTDLSLIIGVRF